MATKTLLFIDSNMPIRKLLLAFALGVVCLCQAFAGPTFLYPKNIEPKVSVSKRESGLALGRKEWLSPTINTVAFEIVNGTNQVLLVVRQKAFGKERIFYYLNDSGYQTTIEHPTKTEDDVLFRIEKNGVFVDGFRFTRNSELEPYPVEWISKIREDEKVSQEGKPKEK